MCGLVGVAGKLEYKDEDLMKRLLCHDYWRGKDSTGLAAVRGNKDIHVAKVASDPLELFENTKFKTALSGYNSVAFIGHNRAATKGKINKYNAHPFEHDHIVGAHNGTLTTKSWRDLEDATGEKFDVDSEALIYAIAKLGIKETIALCEEGRTVSDGAWALTWYDKERNSLNFLRNKWRPFWYSYSKDYTKVFWASEYWMIDAATHSMGYELSLLQEKDKYYRFFASEIDTHYEFDLDKLKKGSDSRPKPKAAVIKGKEATTTTYSYGTGGYDPFERTGEPNFFGTPSSTNTNESSYPQHQTPTSATTGSRSKTNSNNTSTTNSNRRERLSNRLKDAPVDTRSILMAGTPSNPFAGFITKEKFEEISKYGCNHCSADVEWGDVGLTIYERDGAVLCADCSAPDDKKNKQNRLYVRDLKPFM